MLVTALLTLPRDGKWLPGLNGRCDASVEQALSELMEDCLRVALRAWVMREMMHDLPALASHQGLLAHRANAFTANTPGNLGDVQQEIAALAVRHSE